MSILDLLAEPNRYLSKFYQFNQRNLEALSTPYLWFSHMEEFNDPFEGQVKIIYPDNAARCIDVFDRMKERGIDDSWREHSNNAKRILKHDPQAVIDGFAPTLKNIEEISLNVFRNLSYCCLFNGKLEDAENEDRDILMWSHYGDGLKGFKIIFESSLLIESLPKTISRTPVQYSDNFPTIDLLELLESYSGSDIYRSILLLMRHACTKHKAWSMENEYRFISQEHGSIEYSAHAIKKVIFGEKMPPAQRKVITSILSAHGIHFEIFIARRNRDSYSLAIERLPNK